MASSPVQIANRALARLGLRFPISGLSEQSAEAAYVDQFYEPALRETLALLDWRFATRYALLVPSGTAPQPWLYQYVLPADFITPRTLRETETVPSVTHWTYPILTADEPLFAIGRGLDAGSVDTRVLWCDLAAPILRYTAYLDDPTAWEPEFENAFCFTLAAELSMPLTQRAELRTAMLNGRAQSLAQAAGNTAMSAPRVAEHVPDWIRLR